MSANHAAGPRAVVGAQMVLLALACVVVPIVAALGHLSVIAVIALFDTGSRTGELLLQLGFWSFVLAIRYGFGLPVALALGQIGRTFARDESGSGPIVAAGTCVLAPLAQMPGLLICALSPVTWIEVWVWLALLVWGVLTAVQVFRAHARELADDEDALLDG